MPSIEFGVQYNGVSMASVIGPLDFAGKMESLEYRSYFVPELETLPALDPFILLASVAQRTQRMRLGTGVAVLPFRSPYQIAKIATSLDVLSGGRAVLGLGSGGVFNNDFAVEGVRLEDRQQITDERLALVRRLLSETNVTHHGVFPPHGGRDAGATLRSATASSHLDRSDVAQRIRESVRWNERLAGPTGSIRTA